jgi:hypothetical protein
LRSVRHWSLAIVGVALLCSCVTAQPAPTPASECVETPITGKVINGYPLYGRGGEVFLVFGRTPNGATWSPPKTTPLKMLVVVDHPILPTTDAEHIPSTLDAVGRNTFTGTNKIYHVSRHDSELGVGVEWGTNFDFPDAGCWELRLSAPRNADATVIVKVL